MSSETPLAQWKQKAASLATGASKPAESRIRTKVRKSLQATAMGTEPQQPPAVKPPPRTPLQKAVKRIKKATEQAHVYMRKFRGEQTPDTETLTFQSVSDYVHEMHHRMADDDKIAAFCAYSHEDVYSPVSIRSGTILKPPFVAQPSSEQQERMAERRSELAAEAIKETQSRLGVRVFYESSEAESDAQPAPSPPPSPGSPKTPPSPLVIETIPGGKTVAKRPIRRTRSLGSIAPFALEVRQLDQPYTTPVAMLLQQAAKELEILKTANSTDNQKNIALSKLIGDVPLAVQQALQTEKLRAECSRFVHPLAAYGLELFTALPVVHLARDMPVASQLSLGRQQHKDPQTAKFTFCAVPILGFIDHVFWDMQESCLVVCSTRSCRLCFIEGEVSTLSASAPPLEYLFLKRKAILELQLSAALLEHLMNAIETKTQRRSLRVGYVLVVGIDPYRKQAYSIWRLPFDPEFFLCTKLEAAGMFYAREPVLVPNGPGPLSSGVKPIGPRTPRIVAKPVQRPLDHPLLTHDQYEVLLPHRRATVAK